MENQKPVHKSVVPTIPPGVDYRTAKPKPAPTAIELKSGETFFKRVLNIITNPFNYIFNGKIKW